MEGVIHLINAGWLFLSSWDWYTEPTRQPILPVSTWMSIIIACGEIRFASCSLSSVERSEHQVRDKDSSEGRHCWQLTREDDWLRWFLLHGTKAFHTKDHVNQFWWWVNRRHALELGNYQQTGQICIELQILAVRHIYVCVIYLHVLILSAICTIETASPETHTELRQRQMINVLNAHLALPERC